MANVRTADARFGFVVLGLIAALLAIEALLRLGAVGRGIAEGLPILLGGRVRIVCLGDSNTYGLYVLRAQAWPQQVEALWLSNPELRPIQVVNLGYPGMNSSRILNQLPRVLEALHPDFVMVMVGANDYWTMPEPIRDETPATVGMLAWRHSRLYRLLYMLGRAGRAQVTVSGNNDIWRDPEEAPKNLPDQSVGAARGEGLDLELGWKRAENEAVPDWGDRLETNLAAIAQIVRDAGAVPVFVTYPSNQRSIYAIANERVRAAAHSTQTALIDLGQKFDAACSESCPHLFFSDQHPTALGYSRAAQAVVEELRAQPSLLTH